MSQSSSARPSYETRVVQAFIKAHLDDTGLYLNDVRYRAAQRDKAERWEKKELVPMEKVDEFLMHHDLMLFELEMWAQEHLDTTGFVDDRLLSYY